MYDYDFAVESEAKKKQKLTAYFTLIQNGQISCLFVNTKCETDTECKLILYMEDHPELSSC